jgi:putative ABC transport system permease protein
MLKSFLRLTSVDLGFNPQGLLAFWVSLSGKQYEAASRRLGFYEETLDRIRALPGAESAGISSFLILYGATTGLKIEGRPAAKAGEEPEVGYKAIAGEFFQTMGIPLLRGRYFTKRDREGAPPAVIVNDAFVRRYFPGENPLGKHVGLYWGKEPPWREIVGVVGDVRDASLQSQPSPGCYVPLSQAWVTPSLAYVVRTHGQPLGLANAVRRAVSTVDRDQPVSHIETLEQALSDSVAALRFRTELLSAFSLLALILTAVGLYGVLSYSVTQRTHEIGIRVALGAERGQVMRLILGQGMALAVLGMAFGLLGALGLTRFMASLLYETRPTDPLSYVGVSLLLTTVAAVASYVPAHRASRVDPMVALRYD